MYCPSCGANIPDQSTFCLACGKPAAAPALPRKESKSPTFLRIFLLLVLGALAIVLVSNLVHDSDKKGGGLVGSLQRPLMTKKSRTILAQEVVVKPGSIYWVRFPVEPGVKDARVVGQFRASGGLGNDISGVIASESQFENWKNGHSASVFYDSGKVTVGDVNVDIPAGGTYCFGLSNTNSLISEKRVSVNLELRYLGY